MPVIESTFRPAWWLRQPHLQTLWPSLSRRKTRLSTQRERVELPDGGRHVYEVIGIDIVDSRRGSLLLDTNDAMMTLVTCYPFDARDAGGPLRYVVTARMLL